MRKYEEMLADKLKEIEGLERTLADLQRRKHFLMRTWLAVELDLNLG